MKRLIEWTYSVSYATYIFLVYAVLGIFSVVILTGGF